MKRLALILALLAALVASSPATATRPLHHYQTGAQVRGLQWLLSGHQLRRHGHPVGFQVRAYRGPLTGRYDQRTARAVRNTKYKLGWPRAHVNGTRAGVRFQEILKGERTRPASYRLTAGRRAWLLTQKPKPPALSARLQMLVTDANYLIAHAGLVHYSQSTRMQIVRERIHLPPLTRSIYEDCSSSTTGLYWLAAGGTATNPHPTGLPDPNGTIGGVQWSGYGFTGTQAAHGWIVWRAGQSLAQLRPGDLIFYGWFPHHHVTMYLGNGRVFSHGTELGPFNVPALYRSDAVYARRYVTG